MSKLKKVKSSRLANLNVAIRKVVVSHSEMYEILAKQKGVTFSSFTMFGDESGSKTVAGKKLLQKLTFRQITIGASYEDKVNRLLDKQGDDANFEAEKMKGKTFVEGSKVVAFMDKNPEKKYLVCDQENRVRVRTQYFHNGSPISKAKAIELELFAPSYFADKKTAGRGSVEGSNDFSRITPSIENILSIRLNKVHYIVED